MISIAAVIFFTLNIFFIFRQKIDSSTKEKVFYQHIYPIAQRTIDLFIAIYSLYLYLSNSMSWVSALIFWFFCLLFCQCAMQLANLVNKLPYSLKIFNGELTQHSLESKNRTYIKLLTESYWHTCILAISTYSHLLSLLFLLIGLVLISPVFPLIYSDFSKLKDHFYGRTKSHITEFIDNYAPQVIFYCSGGDGAVYQLNQWLAVLGKCDKRVLILIRQKHYLEGLGNTNLPIAYVRAVPNIDLFISQATKIVMYPANSRDNISMLRWNELLHIFVNHGESDKVVNRSRFLRSYDRLYVAGEMAIDKMNEADLKIEASNIVAVGRPQTELTLTLQHNEDCGLITILYAPTWEGFSESADYTSISLNTYKAFLPLLNNPKYKILFKPHPYTGSIKVDVGKALSKLERIFDSASNVEIFTKEKNIHELMNESTIMVSDVSSVLNDYLYTEKPLVLTNPHNLDTKAYHEAFPSAKAAYLLTSDMSDLNKTIASLIKKDSLKNMRLKTKEYSIGIWPEGSMKRFNNQLNQDYQQCQENLLFE
jgi:CDP-glycerol glycerophosphotransferase (TagB/SpsB family)